MTRLMAMIGFLPLARLRGAPGANPQARLGVPPQDTWHGPVPHPITGTSPPLGASRASTTCRADDVLPTPRPNTAMPRRTTRNRTNRVTTLLTSVGNEVDRVGPT
jgi:hypothetical protein